MTSRSKTVEPIKEAPKVEPEQVTPPAPKTPQIAPTPAISDAKSFIYQHESGNNPAAVNASSGACSLGQALPCSKLSSVCPNWATDYACADAWFTHYMEQRYGTWENARSFWLSHNWW